MRSKWRARYECNSNKTFTYERRSAVEGMQGDVISKTVTVLLAGDWACGAEWLFWSVVYSVPATESQSEGLIPISRC